MLREIGEVVMGEAPPSEGEEMTGEEEVQGIDHEWEAQLALPLL